MHNLEQRIAEWRKLTMAKSGVPPETMDELENHLRETTEELVQSGLPEPEAFQRAVKQLGTAPAIASEFQKLDEPTWVPVKVAIGTGVVVALALAIVLIARLDAGRTSFLLASHVFTVSLGYTITFLIGGLGICFVGQRCFSDFSPSRLRSLTRITFILGCIAASLTVVAVVLGMVWAKAEWGRYWAWDPKEIGGFSVVAWLACFLFTHRFAGGGARGLLVMSVLGNIVVGLAWFGANLLGGTHRYGTPIYSLPLLAAVAANFAFFLIGLAPAGWLRPRKA
ncbi:MAG TPA: cytochrome c biogenesis protein CcsA [Terriglobales bacterium]|nr:cytochrome c biogenesis protein CcsA [Terriglobales bacterium]